VFPDFHGNARAVETLEGMIESGRIPQTLLLDGPDGVGKATLARRFAARLLGRADRIEQDDLSLPANLERVAEREKWAAEKRNDEPLFFASHPDFLTFSPDGPLRQIGIPQMRFLREQARFAPLSGARRVFLIDRIDRANEQAANSLLKTLEEPPPHLILIVTAANVYDLLPTIRSRAVPVRLSPLGESEMEAFLSTRPELDRRERRRTLAAGSPGLAVSVDVEAHDRRRAAMLALLEVGAAKAKFGAWTKFSESLGAAKSERLDDYLEVAGTLVEDLLLLRHGHPPVRHSDIRRNLETLAPALSFPWLRLAAGEIEELARFARRNIQKSLALDAMAVKLRREARSVSLRN